MTVLSVLLILWDPWALFDLVFGDMHGPDTRESE